MEERSDLEKEFQQAIVWMLKEIKKEYLATPSDEYVCYEFQHSEDAPNAEDQRRAIQFLKKEGAVRIHKRKYPMGVMMELAAQLQGLKPMGYYLDILQPDFDRLYGKYVGGQPAHHFERFDRGRGILHFAGREIVISKGGKETYALQLIDTIQKDLTRYWFEDEILTDWGYTDDEQKSLPKNRVYHAAQKLNNLVAKETQVNNFVEHNTEKFRINPLYLKSS